MDFFSLVIPTMNRKEIIASTVSVLLTHFPQAEIIVVDDFSSDGTIDYLKKHFPDKIILLENDKNYGKGYSLRRGFLKATGDFIIFTDDDLPYGILSIENILKELETNKPVVIGEREYFNDKFIKKIGRSVFNLVFKPLLGIKLKDTQAGIKGFKAALGKKLFSLSFINRFAIDLEILSLCQKLKIPVTTVPVELKSESPSTFSFKSILEIFFDVLKIKWHHYSI